MRRLVFTGILLGLVEGTLPLGAETPNIFRVAILHGTFGGNRHSDEFDGAVIKRGWHAKKYASTTNDLQRLAGELNNYDLILGCPLFNFNPTVDMAVYNEAFRAFLSRGGAIALTDINYPQSVEWLGQIDPKLTVVPKGKKTPSAEIVGANTGEHPLSFFPNQLNVGSTWAYLAFPRQDAWEIVLRDGDHFPIAAVQRYGRGFVYVTNLRQPNAQTLENLQAAIELQHAGLTITAFEMPDVAIGDGLLKVRVKPSKGADPSWVRVLLNVRGASTFVPTKDPCQWDIRAREGKQVFQEEMPIRGASSKELSLRYHLSLRGSVRITLRLVTPVGEACVLSRETVLPELLDIRPSVYNGVLSTFRRAREVRIGATVTPDSEPLSSFKMEAVILAPSGKTVSSVRLPVTDSHFCFGMELDKKLPPGCYTVRARLTSPRLSVPAEAETALTILAPHPGQAVIDQDMGLLVDGAAFFPLGLYHVPVSDLDAVAGLGLNLVQMWSWDGVKGLDRANELGLKVLWESNFRSPAILYQWVPRLRDHPALLMWYGRDEPYEADFDDAKLQNETMHDCDTQHPTYMVSCSPRLFSQHAKLADIMAVDPYPYARVPLTVISDQIDLAWAATKGEKPVYAVLESFGREPEGPLRAMAYLALTHEARGLLWYPWFQVGGGPIGKGMKNNPDLQRVVKKICEEVRALTPALLNSGRRQVRLADGKIHGLFCLDPSNKQYLLVVNTQEDAATATLELPGTRALCEVSDLFGAARVPVQDGRLIVRLEAYGTRVYTW